MSYFLFPAASAMTTHDHSCRRHTTQRMHTSEHTPQAEHAHTAHMQAEWTGNKEITYYDEVCTASSSCARATAVSRSPTSLSHPQLSSASACPASFPHKISNNIEWETKSQIKSTSYNFPHQINQHQCINNPTCTAPHQCNIN